MRSLGLSIYPDHSSFEDNAKYLELGHKYGFSRIFMSMLEVKVARQKLKLSIRKSLNMEINLVIKLYLMFLLNYLINLVSTTPT